MQLVILLSAVLSGSYLFEKVGDASAVLFGNLITGTLQAHAVQLQHLIDLGEIKPEIAKALNGLRLSEIAFEGQRISELLNSRESALEILGIRAKDLKQGCEELIQLAAFFALLQTLLRQERRQVTPNVSVLA